MRLICPNCGAQYEVTADVIPAAGRDVQCSNCGHTWFETPGASEAAEAEAQKLAAQKAAPDEVAAAPDDAPEEERQDFVAPIPPTPDPGPPAPPTPSQVGVPTPSAVPEPAPTLSAAPRRPAPQPNVPPPPRPPLDGAIADMLREEAAREEAMRAAEAKAGVERQADIAIDDIPTMTPQKQAEAEARVSDLTGDGQDPTKDAIAATVAASRKELLPDIEEINSTLRSDAERDGAADQPTEEESQKRGFRFGFVTMMTFFFVLVAIYLAADQISAAVPALEETLVTYVNTVDNLRLWLDAQVEKVLVMVEPSEGDS